VESLKAFLNAAKRKKTNCAPTYFEGIKAWMLQSGEKFVIYGVLI